jgi:lipoate---protein ligase
VGRLEGHPADLHGRALPALVRRRIDVLVPTTSAVVLGSTQAMPATTGLEVVRRRSGGGAVLVTPEDPVWVDVDLPVGDPLWSDDVGQSFLWLGEAWAAALATVGLDGEVHRGPFEPGRWGRTVCFAGRGPGEVFVDGAKVVGLAQRRTRAGARFQCAVLLRWEPGPLIEAVVATTERAAARRDLPAVARGLDAEPEAVVSAFLSTLGT